MATFTEHLDFIWDAILLSITNKIEEIGVDSEVGFKTIKIDSTKFYCDADLNHGGVLTEVGIDNIFDNDGYSYQYCNLTHEQLAKLGDYINTLN